VTITGAARDDIVVWFGVKSEKVEVGVGTVVESILETAEAATRLMFVMGSRGSGDVVDASAAFRFLLFGGMVAVLLTDSWRGQSLVYQGIGSVASLEISGTGRRWFSVSFMASVEYDARKRANAEAE
jgi:hypothetical protein